MNRYLTCYKGSVEEWEIDHMGHMNVQFYLQKGNHALKVFFLQNGISPNEFLSFEDFFVLKNSHLRFLAEQKAGSPLFIDVGMNSLDVNSFSLTMIMKALLSNLPTATFKLTYKIKKEAPRKIYKLLQQAFQEYSFQTPDYAKPKGIDINIMT